MINNQKKMPSHDDIERAERLRDIFAGLNEVNKRFPVIVEGKKDSIALRKLGLTGEILILHRGRSLYEFCEDIMESFSKVVILLDWDDKGDSLFKTISRYLIGYWEEFSAFREAIKILCQKDIKDVEGIPKLLLRLEGNE
jgi:5S rRNA maturation endonuclease (ribonuclease M5)